MSGSEKKGPLPYNTSSRYPVQQGSFVPPMGAPPPYVAAPPTTGYQSYPQQPYYPQQTAAAVPQAYAAYGQPYGYPSIGHQPGHWPLPNPVYSTPGPVALAPGQFDAAARFDGVAQPTIPPPPPGCAPNAAQLAAMHGQPSVVTQRKGNFWTDGAGGGSTFW